MFCDGVCEKKGKKCGLRVTLYTESGEQRVDCAYAHMINNINAVNKGLIRVQAAIEDQRNEDVGSMERASGKLASALGKGMLKLHDETAKIKADQ